MNGKKLLKEKLGLLLTLLVVVAVGAGSQLWNKKEKRGGRRDGCRGQCVYGGHRFRDDRRGDL